MKRAIKMRRAAAKHRIGLLGNTSGVVRRTIIETGKARRQRKR